MKILKLSRYNLRRLEDELDRMGFEKYDIDPPPLGPFEIDLDDEEDDEDG